MKAKPQERVSCFKLTDDDWYPSYKLDGYHKGVERPKMVTLTFLQFLHDEGWRVCVWGADDCGMHKDFSPEQRQDAWDLFLLLLSLPAVNQGKLKDLGFISA